MNMDSGYEPKHENPTPHEHYIVGPPDDAPPIPCVLCQDTVTEAHVCTASEYLKLMPCGCKVTYEQFETMVGPILP